MSYSNQELSYILFNNRSIELTNKYIQYELDSYSQADQFSFMMLNKKLTKQFNELHSEFSKNNTLLFNLADHDFNLDAEDIIFSIEELENFPLNNYIGKFNKKEKDYILYRGYSEKYIKEFKFFGLSELEYWYKDLFSINLHPTIQNVLEKGEFNEGICFPVIENGKLVNMVTRRFGGQHKYSQAIPNYSVFNRINTSSNIAFICEGTICMDSAYMMGHNGFSISNASWSPWQIFKLYKLLSLNKHITEIYILSDNDNTGRRSALILHEMTRKKFKVITPKEVKDLNDYFLQNLIFDINKFEDISHESHLKYNKTNESEIIHNIKYK